MSRIGPNRRFFWDAPPPDAGVIAWAIYLDTTDSEDFLFQVDNGMWPEHERVTEPEWFPGVAVPVPEGEYDVAICAVDGGGNFSDPLSVGAWQDVPLDRTPPPAPTGGGVDFVG